MDGHTRRTIEDAASAAHAGTRSFGAIVGSLIERGVESYRVDFREKTTTYFLPTGEFVSLALRAPDDPIGDGFDQEAIVDAIRGSQRGDVKYPEFVERAMKAGCVGYVVWIAGKQVRYSGRRGESHVEPFPT